MCFGKRSRSLDAQKHYNFILLGKCLNNSIYKYDGILNLKIKYQVIIEWSSSAWKPWKHSTEVCEFSSVEFHGVWAGRTDNLK